MFLRASVELSSSEWQSHELRDADVEEEEKDRDCGGVFDLFDLPPLTPI